MNLEEERVEALFVGEVAPCDQGPQHAAEETQWQRHDGRIDERPSASAPRIAGPIIASATEDTRPSAIPPTTPPVLKRRQNSERTKTGKFALAATQIARMTSTATLTPCARIPSAMARTPMTTATVRAIRTSCLLSTCPRLIQLT